MLGSSLGGTSDLLWRALIVGVELELLALVAGPAIMSLSWDFRSVSVRVVRHCCSASAGPDGIASYKH
jgi:hypothetical protein